MVSCAGKVTCSTSLTSTWESQWRMISIPQIIMLRELWTLVTTLFGIEFWWLTSSLKTTLLFRSPRASESRSVVTKLEGNRPWEQEKGVNEVYQYQSSNTSPLWFDPFHQLGSPSSKITTISPAWKMFAVLVVSCHFPYLKSEFIVLGSLEVIQCPSFLLLLAWQCWCSSTGNWIRPKARSKVALVSIWLECCSMHGILHSKGITSDKFWVIENLRARYPRLSNGYRAPLPFDAEEDEALLEPWK